VNEVIIKRLHEGVFYSVIMMEHNGYIHEIDSRTSDALAIALRVGCPIYTYPKIISQVLNPQAFIEELKINISIIHGATDDENKKDDLQQLSKEQLTEQLNELLANEEYEKAAAIRDELSKR
jgi:bifunctional DNase/RNase